MRTRIVLLALTLCSAAPVLAGEPTSIYDRNWPQWRGPRGTGWAPHASPPAHWDEATNVRWKLEIPGKGLSSPIVWEDQVFVTTAVPAELPNKPRDVDGVERALPDWRVRSGVAPERVLEFASL